MKRYYIKYPCFLIICLVGIIVLVSGCSNPKKYEAMYIEEVQKLASEYNLNDAVIYFEFNRKYDRKYRIYDLTVNSSDFENLSKSDQLKFAKALNNIRVNKANFLVLEEIISNGNRYKINVSDSNTLEKNGSEYYTTGSRVDSTSTYTYTASITDSQKRDVWLFATYHVKNILKSPSSAKFPTFNERYVQAVGDKIEVRAWVEAQNAFGAVLRNDFVVILDGRTFDFISARIIE